MIKKILFILILLCGFVSINAPSASASTPSINDGLAAHWDWSDDVGTIAVDTTGHGYNLTNTGSIRAEINYGNYTRTFDGNDYLTHPYDPNFNTNDFTVVIWGDVTTGEGTARTFIGSSHATASSNYVGWYFNDWTTNKTKLMYGVNGASMSSSSDGQTIPLNTWNMYTIRMNGVNHTLYRNDTFELQKTATGYTPNTYTDYPMVIGARTSTVPSYTSFFKGSIGEVFWYNRSLTDQEVLAIYADTHDIYTDHEYVAATVNHINQTRSKSSLDITVQLTTPATEQTTVQYTTNDGTAKAGADYIAETGTVTFEIGEQSKTISIDTVVNHTLIEYPKPYFTVSLYDQTGGYYLGSNSTITIYMQNQGGVCYTFDDNWFDSYIQHMEVMRQLNATLFITNLSPYPTTDITKAKIQQIVDNGTQLGVHSSTHQSTAIYLQTHSLQDWYDEETTPVINIINSNGWGEARLRAYPFGNSSSNPDWQDNVEHTYFDAVRRASSPPPYTDLRTKTELYYKFDGNRTPTAIVNNDNEPLATHMYPAVDYAIENGYVINIYQHTFDTYTAPSGDNVTLQLLEYTTNHSGKFYFMSDLYNGYYLNNRTDLYPPALPVSAFTASVFSGTNPLNISFSTNENNVFWDLGDGYYTTEQSFNHTYYNVGNFSVKMYYNNNESYIEKFINVYNYELDSEFIASPLNTLIGNNISFTDKSKIVNSTVYYNWSFGDGTFSNEKNPVHKYYNAGNYTITESITNDNITYSYMTKVNYIRIFNNSQDMGVYERSQSTYKLEYFQTMPLFMGLLFLILFGLMIFSTDKFLKLIFPIYCVILLMDIMNNVYTYGTLDVLIILMFLGISLYFNMESEN